MKMHEARDGKVQKEKSSVHYQRWKDDRITNEKIELKLKDEVIKQMQVNISVKALGVHVNPMLHWKDQFENVKN